MLTVTASTTASEVAQPGVFSGSRDRFEAVLSWLEGEQAGALSHGELEQRLQVDARDLFRLMLQDHLNARAASEARIAEVTDAERVPRPAAERGHSRGLATVFGEVDVQRSGPQTPDRAVTVVSYNIHQSSTPPDESPVLLVALNAGPDTPEIATLTDRLVTRGAKRVSATASLSPRTTRVPASTTCCTATTWRPGLRRWACDHLPVEAGVELPGNRVGIPEGPRTAH